MLIAALLNVAEQIFRRYLGIFGIFDVFQIFLFFAEPFVMLCGTPVTKHRFKEIIAVCCGKSMKCINIKLRPADC
jgi:hypothetical protein